MILYKQKLLWKMLSILYSQCAIYSLPPQHCWGLCITLGFAHNIYMCVLELWYSSSCTVILVTPYCVRIGHIFLFFGTRDKNVCSFQPILAHLKYNVEYISGFRLKKDIVVFRLKEVITLGQIGIGIPSI